MNMEAKVVATIVGASLLIGTLFLWSLGAVVVPGQTPMWRVSFRDDGSILNATVGSPIFDRDGEICTFGLVYCAKADTAEQAIDKARAMKAYKEARP